MTRFRCAIVDEAGVAGARIVDARSRDQAMLLLLAEGVTPSSITRDAPSLAERIRPASAGSAADSLLQDLARLVASGFTIPEAAAAIDGELARHIAAGTPVGEVMAATQGAPRWIIAALTLDHQNMPGALIEVADDAATIASRGQTIRGAWIEVAVVSAATVALTFALLLIDIVAGLALAAAVCLALRNPLNAFRQSVRSIRQADFLLIVGRLLIGGMAVRGSVRIAAEDALADQDKALIDAALANDGNLRAEMGRRLGLSAANQAIMMRGDAVQAMRVVSVHLARTSMPALDGLLPILRMSFAATAAIALIVLALR